MRSTAGHLNVEAMRGAAEQCRLSQFDTKTVDTSAAESAIAEAYELAGFKPPETIVWSPSPIAMERTRRTRWTELRPGRNLKADIVNAPIGAALHEIRTLPPRTYAALMRSFDMRPRTSPALAQVLTDAVGRVGWGLVPLLRTLIHDRREVASTASFAERTWCPYELRSALGLCRFVDENVAPTPSYARLRGLSAVARNVGWIAPYERVCFATERWAKCEIDHAGRPHSATGPAIAFSDGWHRYFWKGVEVPAWMIDTPHRVTPSKIDSERNPLVRRCMIEILTPAAYIRSGSPRVVARDHTGILWSRMWSLTDVWAAVEVVNGTKGQDGRFERYYLQVPGHLRTPLDAVAWSYGMSSDRYAALSKRT